MKLRFWHSVDSAVFLVAAGALSACDSVSSYEDEDEGELFFRSTPAGELEVSVLFPTCLSSCSREVEAWCSISVQGSQITVQSRASVEREGGSCTDECGQLVASCVSEPIAAGVFQLRHGEVSAEVTLPSEGVLSDGSVTDQGRFSTEP